MGKHERNNWNKCDIRESKNHTTTDVGRDLERSSSLTIQEDTHSWVF